MGRFARAEFRDRFAMRLVAACLLALAGAAGAGAQSPIYDDFDDGDDVGWTRADPSGVATWSFPDGGYRIRASGPMSAVAMAVRTEVLSGAVVGADIVSADPQLPGQWSGVGARLTLVGQEIYSGYVLLLKPSGSPNLILNRIDGYVATTIDSATVDVRPALDRYRLFLDCDDQDDSVVGLLVDLVDAPTVPIAVIGTYDDTYPSGATGLVASNSLQAPGPETLDTTFDVFSVGNKYVDTDGDTIWDGTEVGLRIDPNSADTDGDGLSDLAEIDTHLTDPADPDSDDDGLSDGAEVNTHGTSPHDPDSDDDGGSDGAEVAAGASPLVADAYPFVTAVAPLNSNAAGDSGADQIVDLEADAAGNWIAAWQGSGFLGSDLDILMARSSDGGTTWSAVSALNTSAGSDSGNDATIDVATDGAGNWIAVWQSSSNLGGTIGTDSDILVARSTDAGATWTAPAPVNDAAGDGSVPDQRPRVALDAAGRAVVVWRSSNTLGGTIGSDDDILYSRSSDGGVTWSPPAALGNAATDGSALDDFAEIVTDRAGSWLAVWHSTDSLGGTVGADLDLLFTRSLDGGATWSPVAALNGNAATDAGSIDLYPGLATDGDDWVAAWSSSDSLGGTIGAGDLDILVARSSDGGATWTAPAALNSAAASDTGSDAYPRVATDGHGLWVATWSYALSASEEEILVARSRNGGASWSTARPVDSPDPAQNYYPAIASDGLGSWTVAWRSLDSLGGTIGTDMDILFVSSGADGDGDGLAPGTEVLLGTSAIDSDSDDDLLVDGDEYAEHATDPTNADTDSDCLSDGEEVQYTGTDPLDDDSDDDGLTDGYELDVCSASVASFSGTAVTDPLDADSDGDGLQDGMEKGLWEPQGSGTDLGVFVPDADPATTTDPTDADTDDDGLTDGAEDANGNGRVDPGETDGLDPDGDDDGWTDGEELAAGTDPLDPASNPGAVPVPALGPVGQAVLALLFGIAAIGSLRTRLRAAR